MSVLTIAALKSSLPQFSVRMQNLIDTLGLDLSGYQADHIALRVNELALAKSLHQAWLNESEELSVNTINGRPIVVVKTEKPLVFGSWQTHCVELPYPGDKVYAEEGWEHAEWVIPSSATTPETFLEDVLMTFPDLKARWAELESLGVKVKLSSPSGEGERLSNPTVAFKFKGVCVKLHPVSLEQVIESEK
ncbi:VOC family protein [Enterovibrio sp. ZSDZ35]|uniref:VOC family protein n=1 Tax=Enterovibrio qingdaonensis TaxID=2899818 RepID=A0ABT5QQ63_9GAMM|nr:VOC family protein [Enterovibrio sp. ZSDZ35]MDD1783019.1 VOC family protein [Enterovibrio sp. ZSDZ35]